jgi:hypothetical protein
MYLTTSTQRGAILVTLLFVFICSAGGCSRNSDDTANSVAEKRKAAQEAGQRQLAALAKKHGARTDWMESVERGHNEVFAFEIQDVFKRLVGRPILLTVEFNDIYETKDGHRLICSLADGPSHSVELTTEWEHTHFVLDLTQEKAQYMAEAMHANCIATFAVVAIPTRIDVKFSNEFRQDEEGAPGEGSYSLTREIWIMGSLVDAECLPE